MAHSTLFGGNSTTEPITLVAKFSTISADEQIELNELNQTQIQPEFIIPNKTQPIPEIPKDKKIEEPNITPDKENLFPDQLIIGIGIGFAIGLAFVFITKRNSDK